jgi:hypothetical protein
VLLGVVVREKSVLLEGMKRRSPHKPWVVDGVGRADAWQL